MDRRSGDSKRWSILLPPIGHEADPKEAQDHHRPGGGLGDARANLDEFRNGSRPDVQHDFERIILVGVEHQIVVRRYRTGIEEIERYFLTVLIATRRTAICRVIKKARIKTVQGPIPQIRDRERLREAGKVNMTSNVRIDRIVEVKGGPER